MRVDRVLAAAALAIAALALAGPATAGAQIDIDYACAPDPVDCSGWYRSPVTVKWFINPRPEEGSTIVSGCSTQTLSTDTTGTVVWCEASYAGDQLRRSKVIRVDRTAPAVTAAQAQRPPDSNGWYRAPVRVGFSGTDATSGLAACPSATYSGPDARRASVRGSCVDIAGNRSSPLAFGLRYDATGPVVRRARPARRRDHGRWYRRPVRWRFAGSDAMSRIADCPSVRYAGPDGADAHVVGACVDRAGNVTRRAFPLHYDATPPPRPAVTAVPRDHAVHLSIHSRSRSIAVVRAPGVGGSRDSTVYHGRPRGITDGHLVNGRRYRYTVVARDRAANRSRRRIAVVPGPRLLAPPPRAVVSAPPRLRWTRVRDASYYNLQLRRDGRKVLSRWPGHAALKLTGTWRFGGHVRHLSPGTYHWDVWPGFGPRRLSDYGRRIGGRTFVVTAPLAR
jgi:hypothetical protein